MAGSKKRKIHINAFCPHTTPESIRVHIFGQSDIIFQAETILYERFIHHLA
jgi:hypothetical protein